MTLDLLLDTARPGDLIVLLTVRVTLLLAVLALLHPFFRAYGPVDIRRGFWVGALGASFLVVILTALEAFVPFRSGTGWTLSLPASWLDVRSAPDLVPVPGWSVGLWAIGAGALWFRYGVGVLVRASRTRGRYRRTTPDWLGEMGREVAVRFGVRRPVRIRVGTGVRTVMTWGVARPVIHLPACALDLPRAALRSVLGHEMEHVRRYDAGLHAVTAVVRGVFWFHPLVHWALRELGRTQEEICDRAAVRHVGSAVEYARALLAFGEVKRRGFAPSGVYLGSEGDLERRVRRVLDPGTYVAAGRGRTATLLRGGLALTIVVFALGSLAVGASWRVTGSPPASDSTGTEAERPVGAPGSMRVFEARP